MPIIRNEPLIIPEKQFDKLWACQIEISAPEISGEASARVCLLPFNDNGETNPQAVESLFIENIMQKAQDPTSNMAKAMYFLLKAIDDEYLAQNQ